MFTSLASVLCVFCINDLCIQNQCFLRFQPCFGLTLASMFSLFCSAVTRSSHRICCNSVESV